VRSGHERAVRSSRSRAGGVPGARPGREARLLGVTPGAGPAHEPAVRHRAVRERGVPHRARRPGCIAAGARGRPLRPGTALREPLQGVGAAVEHPGPGVGRAQRARRRPLGPADPDRRRGVTAARRREELHARSGSRLRPQPLRPVPGRPPRRPGTGGPGRDHDVHRPVRRVSLWAGATIGASGGEPPPHYQFFLGGANTYYLFPDRDIAFVGLRTQARRGRHVQKAELGAQWELTPDVFARVRWNAGTVLDRWSFDPARYVQGAGVELGAKTFAGRLSLSASGNAHTTWPIVEI